MQTTLAHTDPVAARHLPDPASALTATTLDEAMYVVGRNIHPHRLRVLAPHGGLACLTSALDLGDCALGYVQYGFNVEIDPGVISEYLLVKSTISGQGTVRCGTHTVVSDPRSIIMTSMTEPLNIRMSAECRHLTVRVSRRALEARLTELLGRGLRDPLRFDVELPSDSDFGRAWHELLGHICHLSASAPRVLASEEVRRQYSRTLIELLVHSARHSYSQALEHRAGDALPWHVRRARDYIHANVADIRSVAEIAAAVGITARTLQNGFRKAFNVTPAGYVRELRICILHSALQSAEAGQSVTDLMQAVGIVNFGRYAHYYRCRIGVPPSVTLKRAI
jgi:AraC-like DNA-binding protein